MAFFSYKFGVILEKRRFNKCDFKLNIMIILIKLKIRNFTLQTKFTVDIGVIKLYNRLVNFL